MTWTYHQSSGSLFHDGEFVSVGYSGHGEGLNNPAMQEVHNVGPIPRGGWNVGPSFKHPTKGPVVMRLTPKEGTETFGRDGFLIHGDSVAHAGEHVASEGCVILDRATRQGIADSDDKDLEVV